MAVRLVYKDIPPRIQEQIKSFSLVNYNDTLSSISLERLKTYSDTDTHYATLENNYWRLDGTFKGVVGDDILIWSTAVSSDTPDANGRYALDAQPKLIRTWDEYYTSPGVYLLFSEPDYCNYLNIKWYRDDLLIYNQDYYPDTPHYFCRQVAELFNKVEITFYTMSAANRFLKIVDLIDGRIINFTSGDITAINILEEVSIVPVEDTIPYNTMDVSLMQKADDINYIFQSRQSVNAYMNDDLYGTFFVDESTQSGKYKYDVSLVDYKGLLDTSTYWGGRYINVTAKTIIDDIMSGEGIDYIIDDVTAAQTLTGLLLRQTKREALSQVINACGSICDDSRDDKIRIYKLDNTTKKTLGPGKTFISNGAYKTDKPVTAVNVTVHNYVTKANADTVFEGELAVGTHLIEFSSPVDIDKAVTPSSGVTIDTLATNYCIVTVTAAGNKTITAYVFEDHQTVKTLENTLIREGTPTNEKSIQNNTLISSSNADAILEAMLEYYTQTSTFTTKVWLNDEKPGDYFNSSTDWQGTRDGFIEKVEYSLFQKAIGKVTQHTNG